MTRTGLEFALHPVPTSADVLAILDRIVRRIARRLADETRDDRVDESVDVLAQGKAGAAATWRSPQNDKPTVRGVPPARQPRHPVVTAMRLPRAKICL